VDRSLLRGRLLAGHLVVLTVAALFVRLGFWQLHRLAEVRARNALVEARLSLPPAPLRDLVGPGAPGPDEARYRRAVVEGRYDPGAQVVVPFRSTEEGPGHFLLDVLVARDGTAVLVNRGWVPLSGRPQERVEQVAAAYPPPEGAVRVTGILLPSEPPGPPPRREGTVVESARIDVAALERVLGLDLAPLYLQLEGQEPVGGALPAPVPLPERSEGPHLSYAVQWFLFATVGVVGWAVYVRRSRARRPHPSGHAPARSERPGPAGPSAS
jgi:cytochrome oxidase assembly protein ShyY1